MRITRQQTEHNRAQILRSASRLFRERGYGGVNIAEITAAAGMTHGGFYGHFGSKAALFAGACELALSETTAALERERGRRTIFDYIEAYLNADHVRNVRDGCPVAALSVDASRLDEQIRGSYEEGLLRLVDAVCELMPFREGVASASRRAALEAAAVGIVATLVGCLTMARAVRNDTVAEVLLQAGRASAGGLVDRWIADSHQA